MAGHINMSEAKKTVPPCEQFQYLIACACSSELGSGLLTYFPAGLVNVK